MKNVLVYILLFLAAGCSQQVALLKDSDRIVCFGDSITELGVRPKGYVTLLRDAINRHFPQAEVIGAGISGNKITDLQARLDRDVLSRKPSVVVIYIGINDVWHWALRNLRGTTDADFKSGLEGIIARMTKGGARVVLCTPTVIGEKVGGQNPQDEMLDRYANISRGVARETGSTLCDLRKVFVEYLASHNTANAEKGILTTDRVHLNDTGNELVAKTILASLGEEPE